MSTVKVNTVDKRTGSTLTLGGAGTTVTLACGATQTGFGRTGTVNWQTGSIKTGTFTAVSGEGYFVNTSGGVSTVNLPAGVAGAIVGLKDYSGNWQTNAVTLNPDGSDKIGGGNTLDPTLTAEGGSVLLVFVDSTQGWLATSQSVTESPSGSENFLCASGGTPSQSGDYEIRTFTGSGTFTVNALATNSPNNAIDYAVVAGGGGGGVGTSGGSGGGGAGGYRSFTGTTVSVQGYPVTVGGGGTKGCGAGAGGSAGGQGVTSTFISNSSTGGGGGGSQGVPGGTNGGPGGSGGGGGYNNGTGGTGNTPPVSPSQGNNGGAETNPGCNGGAGGGAGAVGASNTGTTISPGGVGIDISPSYGPGVGVSGFVAGGGGGGGYCAAGGAGGNGGGGAGAGGVPAAGVASNGTDNTGGGGGAAASRGGGPAAPGMVAGIGGSGVVIIRYKRQ